MGVIGTTEIIIIFAVALIAFGPNRLPELARTIAKFMKMFRDASRELQNQLNVNDWDLDRPSRPYTPPKSSSEGYGGSNGEIGNAASSSSGDYHYGQDGYGYGSESAGEASAASAETSAPAAEEDIVADPAKDGDTKRYSRETQE
ncbi:MAG: twin-arginine translocase TatA/TatE family subunit [Candidatus Omnitrophota bacterium]